MHSAAESQEPVQTWFSFTLIGVMDPPFPSGLEKQRVMEWFCSKCHKKTTAHKSHHNPLSLSQGGKKNPFTAWERWRNVQRSRNNKTCVSQRRSLVSLSWRAPRNQKEKRLKPAMTALCFASPAETTITGERCSEEVGMGRKRRREFSSQ